MSIALGIDVDDKDGERLIIVSYTDYIKLSTALAKDGVSSLMDDKQCPPNLEEEVKDWEECTDVRFLNEEEAAIVWPRIHEAVISVIKDVLENGVDE